MSLKTNKKEIKYMELAISLAKQRIGLTGNNPSVGCVIVKKNKIISLGQTGIGGVPHAESVAIDSSTEKVEGATLYSSLEPCSHFGKTPPCTNKIIDSKIKKVIYGVNDIDIRSSNKCEKIFKKYKIKIKKNFLKKRASNLYKSYFFIKKKNLPYVTGKLAITKNNLFKTRKKYITNNFSLEVSHLLRYKNQAILVSKNTINQDNPLLNCRLSGLDEFSPIRIILDKKLKVKKNSNIFKNSSTFKTVIFHNEKEANFKFFLKKKVKLIYCPLDNNKLDLIYVLHAIKKLNINYLLIEGGKDLTKNFLDKNLFNEFYLFSSGKKDKIINKRYIFNIKKYLNLKFKKKVKLDTYLMDNSIIRYF